MNKIVDLFTVVYDGDAKENLGIEIVKACLETSGITAYIHVKIVNEEKDIKDFFENRSPVLIGISTFAHIHDEVLSFMQRVKSAYPDCHIALAGATCLDNIESALHDYGFIDSIIKGELEGTMVDLTEHVFNQKDLHSCDGILFREGDQIIENKSRDFVEDLDSLPFQSRDIFEKYPTDFIPILGARGCDGNCTFCVEPVYRKKIYKKVRIRSAKNIADELEMLGQKYKINRFHFCDPTFEDPGEGGFQRAMDFYKEMSACNRQVRFLIYTRVNVIIDNYSKEDLQIAKQAGLECAFLGIESGNDMDLKLYGKQNTVEDNYAAIHKLRQNNIHPAYGFISFNPYSTYDRLLANCEFLYKSGLAFDMTELTKELIVFPGTPFHTMLVRDGLWLKESTSSGGALKYKFADKKIGQLYEIFQTMPVSLQNIRANIDIEMDKIWLNRIGGFHEKITSIYNEIADLWQNKREYTYVFFNRCIDMSKKNDKSLGSYMKSNEFDAFNKRFNQLYKKFIKERYKIELIQK